MPLRMIELVVSPSAGAAVRAALEEMKTVDWWLHGSDDERLGLRILVEAELTDPLLDEVEKRFGSSSGFRIVIMPAEATLPRLPEPEPEEAPTEEPAPEAKPKPGSISREELLDDLSRRQLTGERLAVLDLYSDPRDPECVRRHSAEIAVRLLQDPGGGEQRPGLFGFLSGAADALVDMGGFEILRDAAIVARETQTSNGQREDVMRAARGFLDEFAEPGRIDRTVQRVCAAKDGSPEAAIELLELGGSAALDRVIEVLAAHHRASATRMLGALRDAVAAFTGPRPATDDRTAIIIKRTEA